MKPGGVVGGKEVDVVVKNGVVVTVGVSVTVIDVGVKVGGVVVVDVGVGVVGVNVDVGVKVGGVLVDITAQKCISK